MSGTLTNGTAGWIRNHHDPKDKKRPFIVFFDLASKPVFCISSTTQRKGPFTKVIGPRDKGAKAFTITVPPKSHPGKFQHFALSGNSHFQLDSILHRSCVHDGTIAGKVNPFVLADLVDLREKYVQSLPPNIRPSETWGFIG